MLTGLCTHLFFLFFMGKYAIIFYIILLWLAKRSGVMRKVKSVRKAWKKFAAVFLSMILVTGLVSGALPLEVLAQDDKIVITGQVTLEGYTGETIPETLIFSGHTVHGNANAEKTIPADNMTYAISGNVVVWRIEIEPEEYLKRICLNIQNKNINSDTGEYCWSWNMDGDFSTPQVHTFEDTLYLIRLMDVYTFYRDIYIGRGWTFKSLVQSMAAPVTMKANHVFQGWNTAEGDFTTEMTASEPMTLYAVYSGHPAKDAWVWKWDDDKHWRECTCGERDNVEIHVYDAGTTVKEPTDTDPGEKVYHCTHMNCQHVRTEVIRSTINYSIVMNGYNSGSSMPNTAGIELWLWEAGSSTDGEPDKKEKLTNTRIEGNKFFYSCAIQDLDTYVSAYIVDGSGFRFPLVDAFLQDGVYEKEFSYHRFQFVSDGETWNEQYLFSSTWLAEPPVPTKENRVFAGWSASDGSIVNLAELKDAAVTERTTLYAVWNHPADDKWEWKSNGDNHWKECNCGDKEEGHTAQWNEGVVTKEPTDTENGEKVYTCEVCGLMKKVSLSITGAETEEGKDESDGGSGNEGDGGSGSEGSGSEGAGSGSGGAGSEGSGSGGAGSEGSGSEGDGSGSGSEGAGSGSEGSGSGSEGAGSGSEGAGGSGSEGAGGSGSEGAGSGSEGSGSGSEGDGSGSEGSGSGSEGESGSGSGGAGSEGSGSEGDGSGSGSEGAGSGSEGAGSGNEGAGGSGSEGESGSGNEGAGGSGSEGDGSGSEGSGSGTGSGSGDGNTETGSGSGTGDSGTGSGSAGTGSGTGSGSSGTGAGSGIGTGAGGTGSGAGGAAGDGSGTGSGGAGSGMGSFAGGETADGAGAAEMEGADASGISDAESGSSGTAHGSSLGTGNGNAFYMSQNTNAADNDNEAVNSGRRNGKDNEPETGDIAHVEVYATIAMIAGLSYLLSYFRDEQHGITEEEKNAIVEKLITWAKAGGYFRRKLALAAIFFLLVYYHSIGKRVSVPCPIAEEIL